MLDSAAVVIMSLRFRAIRAQGLPRTLVMTLCAAAGAAAPAAAQGAHVRQYNLADGVPHNTITAVHQDADGFLWVGTAEGLARFDGFRFKKYSTLDGLGHDYIADVTEDRHGRLWVATNGGGIAWLRKDGASIPFVTVRVGDLPRANAVNSISFDRQNTLWCATDGGIFKAPDRADGSRVFEAVSSPAPAVSPQAFMDSQDRLWVWLRNSGVWLANGAGPEAIIIPAPASRTVDMFEDRTGSRLLVAGDGGVFALPLGDGRTPTALLPLAELVRTAARAALVDSRGTLWLTAPGGVLQLRDGAVVRGARGLPADPNSVLYEDRDGNIWIGTNDSGLYRVPRATFNVVLSEDGQPLPGAQSLVERAEGGIVARLVTGMVAEIDGTNGHVLGRLSPGAGGRGRRLFRSRAGDWWWLTASSICQSTRRDFLTSSASACLPIPSPHDRFVIRSWDTMDLPDLFEDREGQIWFGTEDGLWRVRISPGGAASLTPPERDPQMPTGFAPALQDAGGNLWLFSDGLVARIVTGKPEIQAAPVIFPRSVLLDRQGRLWIGTRYNGVAMLPAPQAARLEFTMLTTRDGLASNSVFSIVEDADGYLYFGTGRGLDRYEPSTGTVRHFSSADGLAGDIIHQCLVDRRGTMWIASPTGISWWRPTETAASAPVPPTLISRIDVAGEPVVLPESGVRDAPPLILPPGRNSLLIEYVAPSFRGEHRLRYEYRLEGPGRAWSAPTEDRSINFARLAPGSYRFAVRAIDVDGAAPGPPALLAFQIQPPVWQRTWFVTIAVVATGAALFAAHRLRLRRLLATERLRRQIATDLHDDIGAGLAQVAILSEVARRQPTTAASHLGEIASLARSMRESMSDIVWSIDPRRDRLADLVERMRQVAMNALATDGIRVEFRAPDAATLERVTLPPDRRRHLLLILKEAVTNVARHARASRVGIEFDVSANAIDLRVDDDGVGFDATGTTLGHGLNSLRERSQELRGELTIESRAGGGTRLHVRVPVR
jgi:signal transduction histidine kinase/ligand-binding sensor domain-containing protein